MKTSKKAARPRMTLDETMAELEAAGSEQARKTYARHGAVGPMFGVSFATMKVLTKRIGVDHELALALWETGNVDARTLAVKIVDPAQMSPAELDRWAREAALSGNSGGYVSMIAGEGPHASEKLAGWLSSGDVVERNAGWRLLGHLAQRDEAAPDALFADRLAEIERTIHEVANAEREVMNLAVISIGCRNAALRDAAIGAARRIGPVDVDHGDTECKTPSAVDSIEKAWAYATSKGFASPAAQERTRETLRRRC